MTEEQEQFLNIAMLEAKKAAKKGEVPIGAVIVRNGKIVSKAHNIRERKQNALYHAEVLCIDRACKKLKSWRLNDCEMYVTLEPCQMCMGAIINSRLKGVYFGAKSDTNLNWTTQSVCLENKDCSNLLKEFFASKR